MSAPKQAFLEDSEAYTRLSLMLLPCVRRTAFTKKNKKKWPIEANCPQIGDEQCNDGILDVLCFNK